MEAARVLIRKLPLDMYISTWAVVHEMETYTKLD